jgi:hypothetical protein
VQEGERIVVAIFPVLGQTSTSIEPADGALDDPALRFDDEAFGVVETFDDLDLQHGHDAADGVLEDGSFIGAVREQLAQERELPEQGGQQQHTAVAILHVGGSDQRMQQQTELIDQNVALLALDQLAGVEAMRIDRGPPFSAPFTLWLSTMQAVGLASRLACSRHFTYSA